MEERIGGWVMMMKLVQEVGTSHIDLVTIRKQSNGSCKSSLWHLPKAKYGKHNR